MGRKGLHSYRALTTDRSETWLAGISQRVLHPSAEIEKQDPALPNANLTVL